MFFILTISLRYIIKSEAALSPGQDYVPSTT